MNDDLAAARDGLRDYFALYIGGMGARDKNFYNDHAVALGYPDAAREIQDHFLARRRAEAAAAVPDRMIDELALVGPATRIKDRLEAWKDAANGNRIDTGINVGPTPESLRVLAGAVL